jgi:hypothetical protein
MRTILNDEQKNNQESNQGNILPVYTIKTLHVFEENECITSAVFHSKYPLLVTGGGDKTSKLFVCSNTSNT